MLVHKGSSMHGDDDIIFVNWSYLFSLDVNGIFYSNIKKTRKNGRNSIEVVISSK